jgi:hypothetical protein
MKEQTAVEFLYEALWEAGKDKFMWQIILQQAKEMEKEQIIDAWKNAEGYNDLTNENLAEQYYTETYGGDK